MTVVVATFGDDTWADLARDRAIPSARALDVPVVHAHGPTLHDARNTGVDRVTTEWVCHLDADDELERGYFDHMARGTADLRAPSVRYVRRGGTPARMPRVAGHSHACEAKCLEYGNWLVIGTLVRTDLVREVGGWRDFPVYEDWDLWARCWKTGATVAPVRQAVYRAHVRPDSRNRGPAQSLKHATHQAIAELNDLPVPA